MNHTHSHCFDDDDDEIVTYQKNAQRLCCIALVMNMRQLEAAAEAGINLEHILLNLADVLKPEIHLERCPHCLKRAGILCVGYFTHRVGLVHCLSEASTLRSSVLPSGHPTSK